jgi:hypothetical protein
MVHAPSNGQSLEKEAPMQALVENVKNTIIGTIRGTGEIVNAVTETVSGSLTTALKGTGSVGKTRRNRQRDNPAFEQCTDRSSVGCGQRSHSRH